MNVKRFVSFGVASSPLIPHVGQDTEKESLMPIPQIFQFVPQKPLHRQTGSSRYSDTTEQGSAFPCGGSNYESKPGLPFSLCGYRVPQEAGWAARTAGVPRVRGSFAPRSAEESLQTPPSSHASGPGRQVMAGTAGNSTTRGRLDTSVPRLGFSQDLSFLPSVLCTASLTETQQAKSSTN